MCFSAIDYQAMDTQPSYIQKNASPLDASMLDSLSDPVILVDNRHVIVDYNRAARQLLGRESSGRKLKELLDSPRITHAIDLRLANTLSTREEVFLPYPVARYYEINVWRLPGHDSSGAVCVMLVLHDITDLKKADQMRADFIANVSHELRSPLSSLLGFIETLRGPAAHDPDATAQFLEIMETETRRMTRLVNDLLALSRVETEEHIQPDQSISIDPILSLVADTLSVRAKNRDMEIKVQILDTIPDIHGDRDEMTQVFQNLVSNAISYGYSGTVIDIIASLMESGDGNKELKVSVINQGDGIPEDEIPRLTERFYRTDKGRSRSMGGTGLGLAIVKHIVARHRAILNIESTPDGETVFSVVFPKPFYGKIV